MKEYLDKLPEEIQRLIHIAIEIADRNSIPAYLVGGFVRDLILGVKNLDLDIVVEGDGIRFAEEFAYRLKARVIRHKRFGTATILLESGQKIDIASARQETYPEPASLPVVSTGSLQDDLKRRDFTINAMAISINKCDFGRLIDSFQGKEDLEKGRVRILHISSFIDDPTRILRAVRFEKRYNLQIEKQTLHCLKEALKKKMLQRIQPQRIREELILLLKEERPFDAIRRLDKLTGFGFISPGLSFNTGGYKLLLSLEAELGDFKKNYPQRRALDAWLIYLIGILEPLDIGQVRRVCAKFVFRKGEEKRIITFKELSAKVALALSKNNVPANTIYELLEPLSYETILAIKAKYKNRYLKAHIADFFDIYNGMRILVSGEDLHKIGLAPGPYYKRLFAKVLNAKLEGKVKTREQELALIQKWSKRQWHVGKESHRQSKEK